MLFGSILKRARIRPSRFLEISRYSQVIQEGDAVLLQSTDSSREPIFTKPVKRGGSTATRWGSIKHEQLIGKAPRELVQASKGDAFRVRLPTLEEYVVLTPRLVTPIYPADANLIVSLLDIHVSSSASATCNPQPLEILEAGTGHGGLTLYLARAIHAANPPRPDLALLETPSSIEQKENGSLGEKKILSWIWPGARTEPAKSPQQHSDPLAEWKLQRRAVVRSLDISSAHSEHAKRVLRGFRRGIYADNVEFEVGNVSEWIDAEKLSRTLSHRLPEDQMFLSHVILDLPGSEDHVEKAASALHVNGILMVFNPSVTQIVSCVELIRKKQLPLVLDRVVEVGAGMTGGKIWDVRAVKPRKSTRNKHNDGIRHEVEKALDDPVVLAEASLDDSGPPPMKSEFAATQDGEADVVMVCRPKVGHRLTGGGFLGVWRKKRHQER